MRRILRIFTEDESRPIGFWLALKLLWWGLWVLLPFNVLHSASVLRVADALLPDTVWGALFVELGVSEMLALASGNYRFRGVNAALYTFVFAGFAIAGWLSAYNTLAVVDYTLSSAMSAWAYWRLSRRMARRPR